MEVLDFLNHTAAQLIALNAPLRFARAETPPEREAVYRLRYEVVVEKGWKTPDAMPDGLERDDYDDSAVQLAVWDGAVLAATTRLVFPAAERPLPTEAVFELTIEPAGRVVDVGRTIIARSYRDARQHLLLQGVIAQSWQEVTRQGYSDICAILTQDMVERYHAVGFEVEQVGAPRLYWGAPRFPVRFDLLRTAAVLMQRSGQDET